MLRAFQGVVQPFPPVISEILFRYCFRPVMVVITEVATYTRSGQAWSMHFFDPIDRTWTVFNKIPIELTTNKDACILPLLYGGGSGGLDLQMTSQVTSQQPEHNFIRVSSFDANAQEWRILNEIPQTCTHREILSFEGKMHAVPLHKTTGFLLTSAPYDVRNCIDLARHTVALNGSNILAERNCLHAQVGSSIYIFPYRFPFAALRYNLITKETVNIVGGCPLLINVQWATNRTAECIVDEKNEAIYFLGGWHDSNMTDSVHPRKFITVYCTRTNLWETLPFTLPPAFDEDNGVNYNLTAQFIDHWLVLFTSPGQCWMRNMDMSTDTDWQRMPDLHHVWDHYSKTSATRNKRLCLLPFPKP